MITPQYGSLETRKTYSSSRDRTTDVVLVPQVLVGDVVFGADEQPARAVVTTGNSYQKVGMLVQGFGVLSNDVVEPEVEFVERQVLLSFRRGFSGLVAVELLNVYEKIKTLIAAHVVMKVA
jgi:hypothetical protein